MTRIAAARFKEQCLKILDKVAETRTSVVVTKRGRPVAIIVPYTPVKKACQGLAGSMLKGLAGSILKERGDPFRTDERWDAELP